MIDMSSIQAAAGSIQTASQLIKSALDVRDATKQAVTLSEMSSKLVEALASVLRTQTQMASANDEIRALKQQILDTENWNTEKARYELKEVKTGVFAYELKASEHGAEPPHKLCAQCYQTSFKSILQLEYLDVVRAEVLVCPKCHTELFIHGHRPSPQPRGRR